MPYTDAQLLGSEHEILAPADFVLPTGRTAIAAGSWGKAKHRVSR